MAKIVKAPDCCSRFLGQLFGRIATGDAKTYFNGYICDECRKGVAGKEVEIDFSDGESYRGMTEMMLMQFKANYAPTWYIRVKIGRKGDLSGVVHDATPLEGAMQVALKEVLKQPQIFVT